ncbi:unnamed protein product [Ostreobium quekettii]|uniref:Uncharacterized protein n=1 Tax=Ostreobium quekettii TaxID=121088 RepID=A0A8S1JF56_9CHLO|nr:unnamed protein product [Ostreobium quekettii]
MDRDGDGKRSVPLLTRLEGKNWQMTAGAVVVNALMLTVLQFDGADTWALIPKLEDVDGWRRRVYKLGEIIAQGLVTAVITAAALNMNFMPPGSNNWKWRALVSSIGLCMLNFSVFFQLLESVDVMFERHHERSWSSDSAHLLLVVAAAAMILVVDFYHTKLFGCFECGCCSCCCGNRVPKVLRDRTRSRDSRRAGSQNEAESAEGMESLGPSMHEMHYRDTHGSEGQASTSQGGNAEAAAGNEHQDNEDGMPGDESKARAWVVQQPSGDVGPGVDPVGRGRAMTRWETRVLVERWQGQVRTELSPRLSRKKAEVGRGDEHRTGLAFVVHCLTSGPTLIRKAIVRNLRYSWNVIKEEEGKFHYSVWMKVAVLTSLLLQVYFCIKTLEFWYEAVNDWKTFEFSVTSALDNVSETVTKLSQVVNQRAAAISGVGGRGGAESEGLAEGLNDSANGTVARVDQAVLPALGLEAVSIGETVFLFSGGFVADAVKYISTLLPKWQATIFIGYPFALLIGFRSVHVVLAQYKRMFLYLAREVELQREAAGNGGPTANETWVGIEKKYPIGGAIFFFGVLTSTAVIQMEIFGLLISLLLAILSNLSNFDLFLDVAGFWLLALLGVLVINRLIVVLLGNWLFSDGLRVHYPQLFFLYMFVFSMVHLVLGVLHAVVRLVFLLLTTVLVLNRLDFTPFAKFKNLDGGHNAFMSMLVLARVIQENKRGLKLGMDGGDGYSQAVSECGKPMEECGGVGNGTGGSSGVGNPDPIGERGSHCPR